MSVITRMCRTDPHQRNQQRCSSSQSTKHFASDEIMYGVSCAYNFYLSRKHWTRIHFTPPEFDAPFLYCDLVPRWLLWKNFDDFPSAVHSGCMMLSSSECLHEPGPDVLLLHNENFLMSSSSTIQGLCKDPTPNTSSECCQSKLSSEVLPVFRLSVASTEWTMLSGTLCTTG